MRDFAVERDRLDRAVSFQHDSAAGRLVAAARLHADVAVFDQVEPADAVLAAELVKGLQHFCRRQLPAVDSDDVAALVLEIDGFGAVRRFFGRHRPAPHRFLGLA